MGFTTANFGLFGYSTTGSDLNVVFDLAKAVTNNFTTIDANAVPRFTTSAVTMTASYSTSGFIRASTFSTTGAILGGSFTSGGSIRGASFTTPGTVFATGAIQGGSFTTAGNVTVGGSLAVAGTISAAGYDIGSALSVPSMSIGTTLNVGTTITTSFLTATNTVQGGSFTTSGAITGGSFTSGGNLSAAISRVGNGTVGAPSYSFLSDTNTGIYRPAEDTLVFVEGGAEAMRIDSSGNVGIGLASPTQKLHVSGNILSTGSIDAGTQFLGVSADTAAAPSFSFTNDTDTGIFRTGANSLGLATGGVNRVTIAAAGVSFIGVTVNGITKAMINLANVENTALSTWPGSTSITTLGTIALGTWNASTIAVARGGTGATDAAGARTNLGAQATITGAATSITSSNLTVSRALVSDGGGKVAVSAVTSGELGYLSGVTSAIQTQLNNRIQSHVITLFTADSSISTGSTTFQPVFSSTFTWDDKFYPGGRNAYFEVVFVFSGIGIAAEARLETTVGSAITTRTTANTTLTVSRSAALTLTNGTNYRVAYRFNGSSGAATLYAARLIITD